MLQKDGDFDKKNWPSCKTNTLLFFAKKLLAMLQDKTNCQIIYFGLSNNRRVWNKRTGQGIFPKINKCTGQDFSWK